MNFGIPLLVSSRLLKKLVYVFYWKLRLTELINTYEFRISIKSENTDVQKKYKIKELKYKNLEPGDKLPSERMTNGVSRSFREAIQKLEFWLVEIDTSKWYVRDQYWSYRYEWNDR